MHDTESESITACKDHIKQRYKMVWNLALWTESLGVVQQAVVAATPEVTVSSNPDLFFYPTSSTTASTAPGMDQVVAVRFTETGEDDGAELLGSEWVNFFALDVNAWNNVESRRSNPTNFVVLPRDSSGNPRVRLVPSPKNAGTLYVLGKMKLPSLGDSDTPVLPGVVDVLLAYAHGDMLERSNQFGKAQAKFQEGSTLAEVMRDLQKNQMQTTANIVPRVEAHWSTSDFI
tara:strand:- start:4142 stop:4834 length:693 start_codon:yes stop_codon:yes gene_type:complete